jgi:hypothetical protein
LQARPGHQPGLVQGWFRLREAGQPLYLKNNIHWHDLAGFGWIWLDLAGFSVLSIQLWEAS